MESHQVTTRSDLLTRLRLASQSVVSARQQVTQGDTEHLHAAIDWLLSAFAATSQTGFAADYSFKHGWGDAYAETTGYIIPTLLNVADQVSYRQDEILKVCVQAGDWLLSRQRPDGAFNGYRDHNPIIFDTGQAIFGLVALFQHSRDQKYLISAQRAADWLVDNQDDDGTWTKHTYNHQAHAYHARVAWALLVLHQITNHNPYQQAAICNLDWVVSTLQPNDWMARFGFYADQPATLHTIGYTLRGLLESSLLLDNEIYWVATKRIANQLTHLATSAPLYDFYDSNWRPTVRTRCLTGLAQVAVVWTKISHITNDDSYQVFANQAIEHIKSCQNLQTSFSGVYGGVPGSWPIWGRYMPWTHPNWAAKFFIDALITQVRYAG